MDNKPKLPRIAITHGDINGIGYEILLKAFANSAICELFTPIIYGSVAAETFWRKELAIEAEPWCCIKHPSEAVEGRIYIIDCIGDDSPKVAVGTPTPEAGRYALMALDRAVQDSLEGLVEVLVTAPINKATMPQGQFPYKGHTEYLAKRCDISQDKMPLMILTSGEVRVALATTHLPLVDVPQALTQELIIEKLKDIKHAMQQDFDIEQPRIAMLALNPHAGDHGLMGKEEQTILAPTIKKARGELDIIAFGPFAADGFWGSGELRKYDAILAMYHDQGLAPFKTLFMESGVNVTAGLPIIRTSPDHGTGYDIAGKNIASHTSLMEAIYLAIDLWRNRCRYKEARKNKLKPLFNESAHRGNHTPSHRE